MRSPLKLKLLVSSLVLTLALGLPLVIATSSLAQIPSPGPKSQSTGLDGKISSAPPATAPSISNPSNGQVFTNVPITVSGLCSTQTVKIFDSNVFVGAAQCINGSYTLKIDLFSGKNDLIARQYDQLDQQSPGSNKVTVTFKDAQFDQFGTRVTLTSPYARKGAAPGNTLTWPIVINGGQGPYAISVDWGDNTPSELLSASSPGQTDIHHVYSSAGTYNVIVRATDKNGTEAFLQIIGVATGKVTATASSTNQPKTIIKTEVLWWPLLIMLALVIAAFFVGRLQQLASIRRHLDRSRSE